MGEKIFKNWITRKLFKGIPALAIVFLLVPMDGITANASFDLSNPHKKCNICGDIFEIEYEVGHGLLHTSNGEIFEGPHRRHSADQYCGMCYATECTPDTPCGTDGCPNVTPPGHVHDYNTNIWEKNDTEHWNPCKGSGNCDEPQGNKAAHNGGNATCIAKAKCSVCQAEYGDYAKHNFSYSATDNVLTATCQNADCTKTVSLTLIASNVNYPTSIIGWCEVEDIDFELDGETEWKSEIGEIPTIHFTKTTIEGTEYLGDTKPTQEGNYTAYIDRDEQKAELNFQVGHIFEGQPYEDSQDGIYHHQKCKYCDNVTKENHDFSECVSNGDGTHKVVCKVCKTVKEGHDKEACSGGKATCNEKAKCEKCGEEYGSLADHILKTTTTKATLTADGKKEIQCTICNKVTKTTKIYAAKTIKLSKTTYAYDGKEKKPTVTVKDSKGKAIATTNYTVKYDDGRKNVGKYNVKITLKGDYKGSKILTFTINPKATTLKSVTPASKAFTAKWTKQTKQVDGYEIQYALDKNFTSSAKKVEVNKNTTTSKKISSLKSKKTYYVRVRTYKKVGTKKYYSDWSKVLSVKTK